MDTWWIDEPHLLGSRNPTDAELEQLRSNGFEIVVSLLRADEQTPGYDRERAMAAGYALHNIPVKDYCAPTVAQLEQFVELVSRAPSSSKIIVHCQGGIGRTGTFAAAYWITKGLTAQDAISRVRRARPHAVETREQEEILAEFARSRER